MIRRIVSRVRARRKEGASGNEQAPGHGIDIDGIDPDVPGTLPLEPARHVIGEGSASASASASASSRQQHQSSPASLEHLPLELWLIILEMLREQRNWRGQTTRNDTRRKYDLSACAAVCRAWQAFFERANFEHLVLHQSDLPQLGSIVHGQRRTFVRWIWLRLELREYDCRSCEKPESSEEAKAHNVLFTNAVWDLWTILSAWETKGKKAVGAWNGGEEGLTLELSAHSPSDAAYSFKKLESRMDDTAWSCSENYVKNDSSSLGEQQRNNHNAHGQIAGQEIRLPSDNANLRVFGHFRGLGFDLGAMCTRSMGTPLPHLKEVKSLVIRRQFYRHFSVAEGLQPIIESLTRLRDFRYEPWRTPDRYGQPDREGSNYDLIRNTLGPKKSLRRVSMFEDFNYVLYPKPGRQPWAAIGSILAESSRNFEELHVAHNVDAEDFFQAFWPGSDPEAAAAARGLAWDNLKYLSLTSHSLHPRKYDQLIRAAAAAAAKKMPKLELMELWYGDEDHSCIFRYVLRGKQPKIQLLSTLGAQFSPQAKACWREVARERGRLYELEAESTGLDRDIAKDHISILQYLALGRRLLTNTSLQQLLATPGVKLAGTGKEATE